ncbi:MAG TPA: sigma 54-interacting transcriptional regulator [Haliangiales bacterium]|nr:sigma 54-interacting transcriptional regulator [Haliangiales bacterium]
MPSLRVKLPGGSPKVYQLFKKLTVLGSGPGSDVVLADPTLPESYAHILYDGHDYTLQTLERRDEFSVNGKKRKKHRLAHEDRIIAGDAELTFALHDADAPDPPLLDDLDAYRKVYEFSARLMQRSDLPSLLDALMDAVIGITHADKGFLVLVEGGALDVKVARNVKRENIADAGALLSDAIIDKVLKEQRPLIISDAMSDVEFASSMSVMNLKLASVMCVPLLERGSLLGLLYVGNDSVKSLFEPRNLEIFTVFAAQASLIIRNALLMSELELDNRALHEQLEQRRFGEIVGASPAMQDVFKRVAKIAQTDISVLITGETGTGKELIAREIHARSQRARGPFVSINCGAIPESLLESELFGHVRGAFTGAVANRAGRFHAADRGTLFLDEIGDMPPALQVKILRALQDKTVVRVGDTRPEPLDIRVLAATNRDLEADIKAGRFREDLYYRLNVVGVHLPPLRDRGDDILVIARYLLGRYAADHGDKVKGFNPNAIAAIRKHRWPGNIRELENRLKKAVVLADKALLGPEDLDLRPDELPAVLPLAEAKEKFQRDYINEVLALNNGNRTKTARDLGVDPRTIFRHLEKEGETNGDVPQESP